MSTVLPASAVAFAAFCVWLGVRVCNRRERWAKWTAVGVVGLVAYPLSLGPVFWTLHKCRAPDWLWELAHSLYEPAWAVIFYSPKPVFEWFINYSFLGAPPLDL